MAYFRNKWDYWHFYGPMVLAIICLVFQLGLAFMILLLLPFLWEVGDYFKPYYNNGEVKNWPMWRQLLFASDGFDAHDMMLGYVGIFIPTVIYVILFLVGAI